MGSELCKTCIHTKVCTHDKNLIGDDIFIPGNPAFFDNKKLFAEYEKRKEAGFPCEDYMPISGLKWTPEAKRLPEEQGSYLVTYYFKGRWMVGIDYFRPKKDDWKQHDFITAWMSLPEPYNRDEARGEKDEQQNTIHGDNRTC